MIFPSRAFCRPGETLEILVSGSFQATIWHLGEPVAQFAGKDVLRWQPPPVVKRGYRVCIQTTNEKYWTAFDVLNHWTDAPRYGYLFDFRPDREDFNLDWLLAHHVNGLQFYDWLYRHDTLLPPGQLFTDPLGRELSLETVGRLIHTAHLSGMAAMPYTAIYAASPGFAAAHANYGLFDAQGNLYDFANGFLKIMNPASPWQEHFVRECQAVLNALPFDGLHVDQYGEPQSGYSNVGDSVDLPGAFAQTLCALHHFIPEDKALVFNLVHNWPLDAIAKTPVDFLYCELWPPQTALGDLYMVTTLNWQMSGGRCPVVAVYIDPAYEHTIKLAQSVIIASGGYPIAHGENGLYLCDPYFPKTKKPSTTLAEHLRRIADFAVAYSELLCHAKPVTVTAEIPDGLWLIARQSVGGLVLNLINATPTQGWNTLLSPAPIRESAQVWVEVGEPVKAAWQVSPDRDLPPQKIDFIMRHNTCQLVVPYVATWTLVYLQFVPPTESE